MIEKNFISWETFHEDTKNLAKKIKETGEYNKIVAVSRGGLIPAGILAYELNIRNNSCINISSYDGNENDENYKRRSNEDITIDINLEDVDDKTLVIDDLLDTGRTFQILRSFFPNAKFVSVYSKIPNSKDVDIMSRIIPDNWVVFPWD